MATIIQTGPDSFIAGDPPTDLNLGQHWCGWCHGDGLEYDYDGELQLCGGCEGRGTVDCEDTACPTHSVLHPRNEPGVA
ncbi:MAG: hypothetical protein BGN97_00135 [Microbacterium sp. 69-10]|uniref:hypothetical protein n=1 Tax=Microbacterium sp. 69-10 TaxID=1895783 RepID=UPI00095A4EC6|nr:hypothetical protein [Microbacterium sp. 69-10]OJU39665.1 MAG: hypothetical protein BGN97_00135 [Microbacterium sp. 69-10]